MKVYGFRKGLAAADENAIVAEEWETPVPKGHDLLVRILAVSVNPVDTKVRNAKADDGVMTVGGWDAAGIVEAVGDAVALFRAGDPVWYAGDITRPGTHASHHLVDERIVAKKPASLSFPEAAAMPLTALTAWESLYRQLGIGMTAEENKGRTLLVINGAGGVGSIALQLARRSGLKSIATASRAESRAWCLGQGADRVIGHDEIDGLDADSIDWILCCHDTDRYFDSMARLLKPFGAMCLLSSAKRNHDVQKLMQKSGRMAWEFIFTHAKYRTPDMISQHRILSEVAALVDAGILKTTLTKTLAALSAETLREAHLLLESGSMIGKLAIPAENGENRAS